MVRILSVLNEPYTQRISRFFDRWHGVFEVSKFCVEIVSQFCVDEGKSFPAYRLRGAMTQFGLAINDLSEWLNEQFTCTHTSKEGCLMVQSFCGFCFYSLNVI